MDPGPGPQARAVRRRLVLRELAFGGLGVFILVGSVFVYADRDTQQPAGKFIALAAIPLLFALGVFVIAWWFWRGSPRPRHARNLEVALDRQEVRRGETLNATVTVRNPSRVRGELQLGLVSVERYDVRWGTRGTRGTYRLTREHPLTEAWQPAATGSVSFTLPRECPCSYEGECISYLWRISARDHRGSRRDPQTDVALWVSP